MRSLKNVVFLSGLVVALTCPAQVSLAQDEPDAPAAGEVAGGTDRGVTITPFVLPNKPSIAPPIAPSKPPRGQATSSPVKPTSRPAPNVAKTTPKAPTSTPKLPTVQPETSPQPQGSSPVDGLAVTPKAPDTGNAAGTTTSGQQGAMTASHSTVSTNTNARFVSAWLDRSGTTPKYKVGDNMVVNVSATVDCNVVVFNYDSSGTLMQIFPNDHQPNGFIRAGERVQIGGPESPFEYQITGNGGMERIFVYAYPAQTQSPLTVAMNPIARTPFRGAEMSYDQYRDLVAGAAQFTTRGVAVVPKKPVAVKPAAATETSPSREPAEPNKVELVFQVEK